LNDVISDLGLFKKDSELLESRLKERNLLNLETIFAWYRHHEKEFIIFFSGSSLVLGSLVYCNNVPNLMHTGLKIYEANEWRFFYLFFGKSLKAVLFHWEEICINTWVLSPFEESI